MGITDKSIEYNKNLVEFIEFRNILDIAIITTLCAINRKESRGGHYRTDYPNTDDSYEKCSKVYKINKNSNIEFEDIKWRLI